MSDFLIVGAQWGDVGTPKPKSAGISGAQRVQDAHAKYADSIMANRVFKLAVGAATPTAYTGGAAGTPLLAIHNPQNSGFYANLIAACIGVRAAGTVAGQADIAIYSGPSVLPTGTLSAPQNQLTKSSTGSSMAAFVNTVLTGSTALSLSIPLFTYYWATAAGAIMSPGFFDLSGLEMLIPGNQLAIGASAVITTATYDVSIIWEEIPFLVTK